MRATAGKVLKEMQEKLQAEAATHQWTVEALNQHLDVGKPVCPDGNQQARRRKPDPMDPEGMRPNPMRTGNMDIFVNMLLCAY